MLQVLALSSHTRTMLYAGSAVATARMCRRMSRARRFLNSARRCAIERACERRLSQSEKSLRKPDLHAAHALYAPDEGELLAPCPSIPAASKAATIARRAGEHGGKRRNGLIQARLDLHLARDIRVARLGITVPRRRVRLRGPTAIRFIARTTGSESSTASRRARAVHAGERRATGRPRARCRERS